MKRDSKTRDALDLVQIQAKLDKSPEGRVWRGLDELAGTSAYRDFLASEFPHDPRADENRLSRRGALKLMAASAAMAGLTACTKLPTEKIVPYSQQQPEDFVPGKPLFYATAMPVTGYGTGLLVESHMGRPTKVEGNPNHPASLGAANVFAQASVLTLYDPDRAQVVIYTGRIGDWSTFLTTMDQARAELLTRKGAGLRILTGNVTSPALADQLRALLVQLPQAKWHQYEPLSRDAVLEGAKLAFGEYVNTVYHLNQAEVIVSLDADFLTRRAGRGTVCARLCGQTPCERSGIDDESPLPGGKRHYRHRHDGRSPPSAARLRCGGLCPRPGGGIGSEDGKHRAATHAGRVDSRTGPRSSKPPRCEPGHCRGAPVTHGPRPRSRDERNLGQRRQDGALHRTRRGKPNQLTRIAQRVGGRYAGWPG